METPEKERQTVKSMARHRAPMSLALIAALGLLLASLGAERGEAAEPNTPAPLTGAGLSGEEPAIG